MNYHKGIYILKSSKDNFDEQPRIKTTTCLYTSFAQLTFILSFQPQIRCNHHLQEAMWSQVIQCTDLVRTIEHMWYFSKFLKARTLMLYAEETEESEGTLVKGKSKVTEGQTVSQPNNCQTIPQEFEIITYYTYLFTCLFHSSILQQGLSSSFPRCLENIHLTLLLGHYSNKSKYGGKSVRKKKFEKRRTVYMETMK